MRKKMLNVSSIINQRLELTLFCEAAFSRIEGMVAIQVAAMDSMIAEVEPIQYIRAK